MMSSTLVAARMARMMVMFIDLDLDVTMRRMKMKPRPIIRPPSASMTTPSGRPNASGGFSNIGPMNWGAMTEMMASRPTGRKPTT